MATAVWLACQVLQLLDEDMASLREIARDKVGDTLPTPTARRPMHANKHVVDQKAVDRQSHRSTPVIVVDKRSRGRAQGGGGGDHDDDDDDDDDDRDGGGDDDDASPKRDHAATGGSIANAGASDSGVDAQPYGGDDDDDGDGNDTSSGHLPPLPPSGDRTDVKAPLPPPPHEDWDDDEMELYEREEVSHESFFECVLSVRRGWERGWLAGMLTSLRSSAARTLVE